MTLKPRLRTVSTCAAEVASMRLEVQICSGPRYRPLAVQVGEWISAGLCQEVGRVATRATEPFGRIVRC